MSLEKKIETIKRPLVCSAQMGTKRIHAFRARAHIVFDDVPLLPVVRGRASDRASGASTMQPFAKTIVGCVASMVIAGCAAQASQQPAILTPTGRPEVVITGATPSQVASELVTACAVTLHGSVSKAEPGQVICSDLPSAGFKEAMWISLSESEVGGHATDEAIFHLLDSGQGIRVIASRHVTAFNAYGSALNSTDWKASDGDLQQLLEAVKGELATSALASSVLAQPQAQRLVSPQVQRVTPAQVIHPEGDFGDGGER